MKVRFVIDVGGVSFLSPKVMAIALAEGEDYLDVEQETGVWDKVLFSELYAKYKAAQIEHEMKLQATGKLVHISKANA